MSFKKEEEKKHCHCHEEDHECHCHEEDHECHCNEEGHECHCHDNECTCNHEDGHCHCDDDCNCGGECDCEDCTCGEKTDLALEYLNMAKIIQADFDNYRKRSIESIKRAKQDGVISAVECILPCLDVFKNAKEMLKDESSLKGIEMVEKEMILALEKLGVKKIETKNQKFDPKLHHALSIIEMKDMPDGQIVEEYKAGYTLEDKVIRYSQVIVNKLKEEN